MHKPFLIFQFFNYQVRKELQELVAKINTSGAAAVFDLEDSMRIPFDDEGTNALKKSARKIISEKVFGFNKSSLVTGIRVNSLRTPDYKKDLDLLAAIKSHHSFNYIFIPKIENALHLKEAVSDFEEKGINGVSFVPIVESKRGYDNLENITGFCRLNHIEFAAFGHCDYNKDVNAFPFIHPGSVEYVDLIKPFVETVERAGLKFVGSPFLELKNSAQFEKILSDTADICKNSFAQVTLSKSQTECVKSYLDKVDSSRLPESNCRTDEPDRAGLAGNLIKEYESFKKEKSGIVINDSGRLLSPQEYERAKEITGQAKKEKPINAIGFNVCILGGCLPVQERIRSSDLYHSILCERAEKESGVRPEVVTERYDSIGSAPGILKKSDAANDIDCLIFHVRPDPFLINTKLFARYIGKSKRREYKFNLHALGFSEPLSLPVNLGASKRKNAGAYVKRIKSILRNLNYIAGWILGNYRITSYEYEKVIMSIKEYCEEKSITLIVAGPPARPRSKIEMFLLKHLARRMKKKLTDFVNFVDAFYSVDEKGNTLFFEDYIHYNQTGHKLFAEIFSKYFLFALKKKYQANRL